MNAIQVGAKFAVQGLSCSDTGISLWADLKTEQLDAGGPALVRQPNTPIAPPAQGRILGLSRLSAWWLGRQRESSFAPNPNGAQPHPHDVIEARS